MLLKIQFKKETRETSHAQVLFSMARRRRSSIEKKQASIHGMYVAGSVSKYILHRVATETIGTSHSGACHYYHSVVAATGT